MLKDRFGFFYTIRMVRLCLDEALCKHLSKVIGGLNIIGDISGIFLKKPGKIMDFFQSGKVGTLRVH